MASETRSPTELERVADEQAALRRVATLVATGATEGELAVAVSRELGSLFGAQRASTIRWEGETIRIVGEWTSGHVEPSASPHVVPFGGDTITARVVETAAPARVDSAAELRTEFARRRWAELGLQASIGAPIVVDGEVWGVVTVSRTRPGDVFPPESEHRLGDFAALVAQAVVNAEARRETAVLVAEQSALRRIATLVAGGKPRAEVLDSVTSEVCALFRAAIVELVRWEGVPDEVAILHAWGDGSLPAPAPGSVHRPGRESSTIRVLETGFATRSECYSPGRGAMSTISAPVIVSGELIAALTASRPDEEPFPPGAEIRLRSFADLAAQSIANDRAQAELRASRERIVRTADETRARLERNLHDGAQQRLVSVSVILRLAVDRLAAGPDEVRELLVTASGELAQALDELRDLARGLHPAVLAERGFTPALEALAARTPVPVTVENELLERMPLSVEAALYFVVAESLTNVVRYAEATQATVRATHADGAVRIEVADDGVGGADLAHGSGLRGLADRIEALGGRFGVESVPGEGTLVWAELHPGRADPVR